VNKPSKFAATAASASLSALFILVYGSCNWITAHRHDVGTWRYDWERFIPFVPLMIVPYMSLDLFYIAAPFLCARHSELRTLAKRIAFAILVAGAFFLLFPLKLAVQRPQPGSWTGVVFNFLHGFDQPYNLFPSLHIALRTILADLYARHTKGLTRIASHVWFSLIGFSTLLTYQHHLVDIAGGFVLALFCFYLFPENPAQNRTVMPQLRSGTLERGYRVGLYYALGSVLSAGLAELSWPWTAIFLWPAFSLAVATAAYWGLGPGIYRKTEGRLPLSARLLVAPNLLGQHLSLLWYRRQCEAWSEVAPRVWIGIKPSERQAQEAKRLGVTAVLDLTAEFSNPPAFRNLVYWNIPVLDLTEVTLAQLRQAAEFISRQSQAGVVYVHCKAGYSRSAAAVAAWLLASDRANSVSGAMDILRQARPGIILRPEVPAALNKFEAFSNVTLHPKASAFISVH
jgi:membrane-associated phospholipid phosphatase/predicted protein tyrosine phosphatase